MACLFPFQLAYSKSHVSNFGFLTDNLIPKFIPQRNFKHSSSHSSLCYLKLIDLLSRKRLRLGTTGYSGQRLLFQQCVNHFGLGINWFTIPQSCLYQQNQSYHRTTGVVFKHVIKKEAQTTIHVWLHPTWSNLTVTYKQNNIPVIVYTGWRAIRQSVHLANWRA